MGGSYRQSVSAQVDSGSRLGGLVLGIGGNFDRRPSDPFYGIGNTDRGAAPQAPMDPASPVAFETFHRYQEARAFGSADVRLSPAIHATGSAALTDLRFAPSDTGIPIDQVYDTASLAGFDHGVRHVYTELELRWDTRERVSKFEPIDLHAVGSLVRPFLGRVNRIDGGADFWRRDGTSLGSCGSPRARAC